MNLQFRLEAAAARAALAVIRRLPPERASHLGGVVARSIGPLLPVSRVAGTNLRIAFPEMDEAGRQRILRGAWYNLGCTVAELPHLAALRLGEESGPGFTIENEALLHQLAAKGGPALFFGGHLGNWEILGIGAATAGIWPAAIYRAAANPAVDDILLGLRREAGSAAPSFRKGARGARDALGHLMKGGFLGMLMDQKMNDGIEVSFFGRPAMTAPALASLAMRFKCPVVGVQVMRTGPARFHLRVEDPLPLPCTGNRQGDIMAFTQAVTDRVEAWVRESPESWLWMHRRFAKEVYK